MGKVGALSEKKLEAGNSVNNKTINMTLEG